MRFAVIANPSAEVFRRDPSQLDALYKVTSSRGLLLQPTTLDALDEEIQALADDPPEFLAVAGGNGTLGRVVTSVLKIWAHDALPPIALLPAGAQNTVARSVGIKGDPVKLAEAFATSHDHVVTRRQPLRVGNDRWGFLFGMALLHTATAAYDQAGDKSQAASARQLVEVALSALLGREHPAFERVRCDVVIDGRALPLKEWLMVAAGSVDHLGVGLKPFAGSHDAANQMGVFASASKPSRAVFDLIPFALGRKARHSLAFHHAARELRIDAPGRIHYALDGDLAEAKRRLYLTLGPPLSFLLPPGTKRRPHPLDEPA